MSTQVADSAASELSALFINRDPYRDWTPVVTQSGAVAVTVTEAKYRALADFVHIYCQLSVTGAGTGGNAITVSGWPAAINPNPGPITWPLGVAQITDQGVATYAGTPQISTSATALQVRYHSTNQPIGANPNFALANTDIIFLNMYWKI